MLTDNSKFRCRNVDLAISGSAILNPWDFVVFQNGVVNKQTPIQMPVYFPDKAVNGDQIAIKFSSIDDGTVLSLNSFGKTEDIDLRTGETVIYIYCPNNKPQWRIFFSSGGSTTPACQAFVKILTRRPFLFVIGFNITPDNEIERLEFPANLQDPVQPIELNEGSTATLIQHSDNHVLEFELLDSNMMKIADFKNIDPNFSFSCIDGNIIVNL